MRESGFITISRKITEWEWSRDPQTVYFWVHLLLKANWRDGRFKGHCIKRGQFVSSYPKLASELLLTMQCVRTLVSRLKSTGELTCTPTNKFTIFTIVNYNTYQNIIENPTDKSTHKTTGNQQSTNSQLTVKQQQYNKETREQGNKETIHTANPGVNMVFAAYCRSWDKSSQYKLTPQRRQWIRRAIEGYGLDACLFAIKKFKRDPWPERGKFQDLKYLFGKQDRIDRWCGEQLEESTTETLRRQFIEMGEKKDEPQRLL